MSATRNTYTPATITRWTDRGFGFAGRVFVHADVLCEHLRPARRGGLVAVGTPVHLITVADPKGPRAKDAVCAACAEPAEWTWQPVDSPVVDPITGERVSRHAPVLVKGRVGSTPADPPEIEAKNQRFYEVRQRAEAWSRRHGDPNGAVRAFGAPIEIVVEQDGAPDKGGAAVRLVWPFGEARWHVYEPQVLAASSVRAVYRDDGATVLLGLATVVPWLDIEADSLQGITLGEAWILIGYGDAGQPVTLNKTAFAFRFPEHLRAQAKALADAALPDPVVWTDARFAHCSARLASEVARVRRTERNLRGDGLSLAVEQRQSRASSYDDWNDANSPRWDGSLVGIFGDTDGDERRTWHVLTLYRERQEALSGRTAIDLREVPPDYQPTATPVEELDAWVAAQEAALVAEDKYGCGGPLRFTCDLRLEGPTAAAWLARARARWAEHVAWLMWRRPTTTEGAISNGLLGHEIVGQNFYTTATGEQRYAYAARLAPAVWTRDMEEACLWRDATWLHAARCGLLAGHARAAEGTRNVVHAWGESDDGWRPAGQRVAVEPWKALVIDPFDAEETIARGWGPIDYRKVGPLANDRARFGHAAAESPAAGPVISGDHRESPASAAARVGSSLFYAWPTDAEDNPLALTPEDARERLLADVDAAIAALPPVPWEVVSELEDDARWLRHVAAGMNEDDPPGAADLYVVHRDDYQGGRGYKVAVAADLASWRMGAPLYTWQWTRSEARAAATRAAAKAVAAQVEQVERAVNRLPSLREDIAATTLYVPQPHVWTADNVVEWVCETEVAVMRWHADRESAARRARHDEVRTERTRARAPQPTQPSGFGTLGDLLKAKGKPLK